MSQRPTDEEMERRINATNTIQDERTIWRLEAYRARDSEVEKDATIKAVADALWATGVPFENDWHDVMCHGRRALGQVDSCFRSCVEKRAALNLAGRLP